MQINNGLEIALAAILQNQAPIGRVVARSLLPGGELAHQRNHRRLVEQAPEGIGDGHGKPAAGAVRQVGRRIEGGLRTARDMLTQ